MPDKLDLCVVELPNKDRHLFTLYLPYIEKLRREATSRQSPINMYALHMLHNGYRCVEKYREHASRICVFNSGAKQTEGLELWRQERFGLE